MSVLQSVMDHSSNGIIVIHRDGEITHINKKAKAILGLSSSSEKTHPAGKIEPGDIVILADVSIGKDDGNLSVTDLRMLGIVHEKIRETDGIIAIGTYASAAKEPVFKYLRAKQISAKLQINEMYSGIPISVTLDIRNLYAEIKVYDDVFRIPALYSAGHMVVIDHRTGKVKFWQDRGYTIRNEAIGTLLRGASYLAKDPDSETDIIGKGILDVMPCPQLGTDVESVLSGATDHIMRTQYETNQAVIAAAIYPVIDEGKRTDVVMRFRDILDIHDSINERNVAIINSEWKRKEIAKLNEKGPADSAWFYSGGNSALTAARQYAYKLAEMDCNITIVGESGTGKTFLANEINARQSRKGPFIQVDCSTIPSSLFESEMFGYVGGAFTGADAKGKAGFFEAANGGTILLDEIGEVPYDIQAKLLNLVQNKVIYRVGSTVPIRIDVRIIAATNRNLKEAVKEGTFRSDLYYRLSAFCVELPPLRDCRSELHLIIGNTLKKLSEKYGMENKSLSGEAFSKLFNYSWPGNIREMENVLEWAFLFSETDIIYPEFIRLEGEEQTTLTMKEFLFKEEGKYLEEVIAKNGSDRNKTIQELGLSKSSFYNKIKEHGINIG